MGTRRQVRDGDVGLGPFSLKHRSCALVHQKCIMLRMPDWNDFKYFLAVARSGTTLGASRMLQVSQSTVSRRIAALEQAFGLELFEKHPSGYVPTEAGRELLESAEGVEAAAKLAKARADAMKRGLTGSVRFTTNQTFATLLLMQAIRDFRATYPSLRLDLVATDDLLDLRKGEADVALRAGRRPTEPDLVGRCVAKDVWSYYCSRDYAEAHGKPERPEDLARHAVISVDPHDYPGAATEWVSAHVPENAIILRSNNITGLHSSLKAGVGVTMMSDFVCAGDPSLVYCFTPDIAAQEIWLLTSERLRNTARVRAVMDFFGGYFAAGLNLGRAGATDTKRG